MARVTISDEMFRNLEFIMEVSIDPNVVKTNRDKDKYIYSIVELACSDYWEKWYKEYNERLK